jgi:zinc and cadmium transporter
MEIIWLYSILSVTVISLLSFSGALALVFKEKNLSKIFFYLTSFSAGVILGDVFIHLIPETFKNSEKIEEVSILVLLGIILFFIFEKYITWWHHSLPVEDKHMHPAVHTILWGDGLHNLVDGMIIAGSFLVSPSIGLATTIAIAFHEIPHEIGNLGVLIEFGLSAKRALFFNFLSALPAIVGAIIVLLLGAQLESFITYVLSFTIGGFIYIACSHLMPKLNDQHLKFSQACLQLIIFLSGIVLMSLLV